jgi:uncharacterized protein GlcG (DUF336 family)
MRQIIVLMGALAMLVAQPLTAAETGPLAPGKPSGVKPAQAGDLVPIYGGVLLFGALLAVTIGVSGSSISQTAALQSAVSTTNCCG